MKYRSALIALFMLLAGISLLYINNLRFSFDFEQFFPDGDQDLEFFRDFIEEFETDDNFLLIAVRRSSGVFDSSFLHKFHDFTLHTRALPHVTSSFSLTKFSYPLKTPFALTTVPAIHLDQPAYYATDKARLLQDERFVYNLISDDARTLVVYLKIVNSIQLEPARQLMHALNDLIQQYDFETYHYLGRPYFQKELVAMQKREITVSAIVSGLLVMLIMIIIFRKPWAIAVALISIGIGMLLFVGFLGFSGRELNAMAALYPVLMIIVGTSDVIHIMSKYIDELRKGQDRATAMRVTVREIGIATLLTSITTAIGFATLLSSRIEPIRDFGLNAAIGVIIAYITVLGFTTSLMTFLREDQIVGPDSGHRLWEKWMKGFYLFTLRQDRKIAFGALVVLGICAIGISMITTNYSIITNMPKGKKITADFKFFEKELTGFRPMEFAIMAQNGRAADDFEVVQQMDRLEQYLRDNHPSVKAITSLTTVYKTVNQMLSGNRPASYRLPESRDQFERQKKLASKIPEMGAGVLVSKDRDKARISSRILDMGADTIKQMGRQIDQWIASNIDSKIIEVKRTGTGLIIDKNAVYVRRNILWGLGIAIGVVSMLMAVLFGNLRMVLISLVPNILPLLLAGALLGFIGIELEAGISIVFAVIFGIAVDDTIHFLSKYKLALNKGMPTEMALHTTFSETGKAICLTTIILFFGFLVMLFSIHPPSVIIGTLISLTLFSALFSDLLLIPLLIRWFLPKKQRTADVGEAAEMEEV